MARIESISYWRGKSTSMPTDFISGRILMCDDTGDVYFDFNDYATGLSSRIKLTDTAKFNIAGGTFTGPIYLYREPIEEAEAATKKYVDALRSDFTEHDDDSVRHITSQERQTWNNKVDKQEGMGLSQNSFTNAEKEKLLKISDEADNVEFTSNYTTTDEDDIRNNYYTIGTLKINTTTYRLLCPITKDISGNSETATKLKAAKSIDGVAFDGSQNIIHYGVCDNAANVDTKIVTIDGFSKASGAEVTIVFNNSNSATNPQLNISNTGASPIYYNGAAIPANLLTAGAHRFVFTGNRYEMLTSYDTTYQQASTSSAGLMSAQDKAKLDQLDPNKQSEYILPVATRSKLGGIIVGEHLNITDEGVLSAEVSGSDALEPFTGCTDEEDGTAGLVPAPAFGMQKALLFGDGEWHDGTAFQGATATEDGAEGFVPYPVAGQQNFFLKGDGTWSQITFDNIPTIETETIDTICIWGSALVAAAHREYPNAVLIDRTNIIFVESYDMSYSKVIQLEDTSSLSLAKNVQYAIPVDVSSSSDARERTLDTYVVFTPTDSFTLLQYDNSGLGTQEVKYNIEVVFTPGTNKITNITLKSDEVTNYKEYTYSVTGTVS